jgi:hypothetical protein
LFSLAASAHPQGFHKRLIFTLTRLNTQGLVLMDVDGGERCSLIRSGADANHDGLLTGDELTALKARLVAMALKSLKVSYSGALVPMKMSESKLALHEDPRVGEAGLSVAILIEVTHPMPANPGMAFEVADVAPDLSAVNLQVFQASAGDAGAPLPFEADIEGGRKVSIRLGALAETR